MSSKTIETFELKNAPLLQGEELQLRKAHYLLRALDHKLRIDIILFIHEKKSCTVTDIFVHFRLVQAVASQHLAILRRAGMVATKRQGKNIFYSLNYSRLNQMLVLVGKLN
jgi:DNA-binding transcriptional ArsR family regulator